VSTKGELVREWVKTILQELETSPEDEEIILELVSVDDVREVCELLAEDYDLNKLPIICRELLKSN